jgi:hypothetical protein
LEAAPGHVAVTVRRAVGGREHPVVMGLEWGRLLVRSE